MLPNPSGLNAHFTLDNLAAQFAALRAETERDDFMREYGEIWTSMPKVLVSRAVRGAR